MKIEEIRKKLEESTSYKDIILYRGRLIDALKDAIKFEKNEGKKKELDTELYIELKKHRDYFKKASSKDEIPLSEKVGYAVKEISTIIEVFLKKRDLLGVLKNSAVSTVLSSVVVIGMNAGLTLLFGGVSGPILVGLIPTISYIGLSNVINSLIRGTNKTKFYDRLDTSSDDIKKEKDFVDKNIVKNEEFLKCYVKETKINDLDEKIENERKLIDEYKKIIEAAPSNDLKKVLKLEMINIMKGLKSNLENKESKYIGGVIKLTNEEADNLEKEIGSVTSNIHKEEMFVKEVMQTTVTNIGKSAVTMYLARMILSPIFPSLNFASLEDYSMPLLYTILNNIVNASNISKRIKMQKSNYTGTIIAINRPDLFEEERKKNNIENSIRAI